MLLIPAIDLKNGQCVRLRQGRLDDVTVFSNDPVSMAKRWADEGAQRIHVVDLDGAFKGVPGNLKAVEQIAAAVNVPVQAVGGLTLEQAVRTPEFGAPLVVIGAPLAVDADAFRTADGNLEGTLRIICDRVHGFGDVKVGKARK